MKLIQKLLNKFNGLRFPQEYLCIGQDSLEQPLFAYLLCNDRPIKDITTQHSFVGYNPLVLALSPSLVCISEEIRIAFSPHALHPNEIFRQKDAIALLRLQKIKGASFGEGMINLYEGIHGEHRFIHSFYQYLISLNNRFYNRKKDNVFLHANLYRQVQIAYALPRNI